MVKHIVRVRSNMPGRARRVDALLVRLCVRPPLRFGAALRKPRIGTRRPSTATAGSLTIPHKPYDAGSMDRQTLPAGGSTHTERNARLGTVTRFSDRLGRPTDR